MTPQDKRQQALAQQLRIEETYCASCPYRSRFLTQDYLKSCKICHHGHELRKVGKVLDETMADIRLQRAGVIV